jgi:tRNA-dihydrouridine synthase B
MRSGFSQDNRNAPDLAYACQEEGASMVTIHWRTRVDRYGGQRSVDKIAEAVDRLTVPVVGNGDIVDIASAKKMLDETGCAGLMVGRGVMHNPWLIRQLGDWMRGEKVVEPTMDERRAVLLAYVEEIEATFDSQKAALGRIKGLCGRYLQAWPQGAAVRQEALRSSTIEGLLHTLERAFSSVEVVVPVTAV